MKRYAVICVALCCVVFMCFSCASSASLFDGMAAMGKAIDNPVLTSVGKTGTSISKAAEEITPEQEYYIGRAVAASILQSYDLYRSDSLEQYLNLVCQVLAANSARPELYAGYHAAVLDTDQINAFATSGGHILITRGLLACTDSEDALAAVIAHEIAHIQLQHNIKAIKTSRISGAFLATAGTALTLSGNEDIAGVMDESVNEIVVTLVNTGYSKSQEYDADKTAVALMSRAGYDPAAMIDMLALLKEKQPHSSGGFASTHPPADSRIEEVSKDIKKYPEVTVPAARTARFENSAVLFE